MKICFYNGHPYWSGICNNGGSRTILKSADTLRKMGHRVSVVARIDRFTWFEHKKTLKVIPKDTEAVIAVSISDVELVMEKAPKHATLAYWARPFETWQRPSAEIYRILRKFTKRGNIVMCNSGWQVRKLKKNGIKSHLVFSGLDCEDFYPDSGKPDKITVGALSNTVLRKQFFLFIHLMQKAGDKFNYFLYGNMDYEGGDLFLKQPGIDKLRRLYSSCHVWVATSTLEGFHNPPAEAGLCGALVMVYDHKQNGSMDYVSKWTGETYTDVDELIEKIENADYSKVAKMQRRLRKHIGNRKHNMKKMVEILHDHKR